MDRWRVPAPIGMYNLGNTCFMSAVLQCLIHCVPLQHYFLRDIGHNHEACAIYRKKYALKSAKESATGVPTSDSSKAKKSAESICLACEMDKLFLRYTSSAIGVDVMAAVSSTTGATAGAKQETTAVVQGDPLVTADMLTVSWKCGGMKHLAGYEQRDAHEFLHGFLEILGRHTQHYRSRMYRAINTARPFNSFVDVSGKSPSQFGKNQYFGVRRC